MFDQVNIPDEFITEKISWEEIKKIFGKFSDQWIFRGQSNDSIPESILYRNEKCLNYGSEEERAINDFKNEIDKYPGVECSPVTKVDWLCLMRHYGYPSRILDWTSCPYIATFFAFKEDKINSGAPVVWAVNKDWLKYWAIRRIKTIEKYINCTETDLTTDECFNDIFIFNNDYLNFVYPFLPSSNISKSGRISKQKSVFLCPGNPIRDFMTNLCCEFSSQNNINREISDGLISQFTDEKNKYIYKLRINIEDKDKIINDLKNKNITEHSLSLNPHSLDEAGKKFKEMALKRDEYWRNWLSEEINI
ncbi:MAG: FRG domain-containing protein [Candidatus Omnitrophota bacterium]